MASTVLLPNTSLFVTGISPFSLGIQLNQMKQFKIEVEEEVEQGIKCTNSLVPILFFHYIQWRQWNLVPLVTKITHVFSFFLLFLGNQTSFTRHVWKIFLHILHWPKWFYFQLSKHWHRWSVRVAPSNCFTNCCHH